MSSEDWRRSQANQRNLTKVFRRLEEAERGAPLNNGGVGESGITVWGGSIRILEGGNLEVDGAASFAGDTAVGGELDVTGNATFSGNVAIVGTLQLPAGIIGNDALANPLTFVDAEGDLDGFAIPTAMTTMATAKIVVPAGFTRALVIASGNVVGFNGTPDKVGISSRVFIRSPAESYGRLLRADTSADNRLVSMSPMKQELLSGLSAGQEIFCDIRMAAATALAAAGFNGASINAYGIFQR